MSELGSVHFIALIPAMWCFISWLLSRLSGWSKLAARFPARMAVTGESARMRTGRIGVVNYHSCLRFQINDEGLGIAVVLPLRLGHPPLFIPWSQFHRVTEDTMMYSQKIKVSVGRPTLVRMTLPGWVRYRMPLEMRPRNSVLRV